MIEQTAARVGTRQRDWQHTQMAATQRRGVKHEHSLMRMPHWQACSEPAPVAACNTPAGSGEMNMQHEMIAVYSVLRQRGRLNMK